MKAASRKLFAAALFAAFFACIPGAWALGIALIGDSTVCDYPDASPRRGWGQLLPEFLSGDVTIQNEAERGKSAENFPAERWQLILKAHPDFVLIQFGHNDSSKKCPLPKYKQGLARYIRDARNAGITPVLVTPMHRRIFEAGTLTDEMADYVEAMKQVHEELGVPLIDLHEQSRALFQSLGEQGSAPLTINHLESDTKEDRTHFTEAGARKLAGAVASMLKTVDPRLAQAVKTSALP